MNWGCPTLETSTICWPPSFPLRPSTKAHKVCALAGLPKYRLLTLRVTGGNWWKGNPEDHKWCYHVESHEALTMFDWYPGENPLLHHHFSYQSGRWGGIRRFQANQ